MVADSPPPNRPALIPLRAFARQGEIVADQLARSNKADLAVMVTGVRGAGRGEVIQAAARELYGPEGVVVEVRWTGIGYVFHEIGGIPGVSAMPSGANTPEKAINTLLRRLHSHPRVDVMTIRSIDEGHCARLAHGVAWMIRDLPFASRCALAWTSGLVWADKRSREATFEDLHFPPVQISPLTPDQITPDLLALLGDRQGNRNPAACRALHAASGGLLRVLRDHVIDYRPLEPHTPEIRASEGRAFDNVLPYHGKPPRP
jgi:hypothetical protein